MDELTERLRQHADAHEYIADADDEQRQWMLDLREAANEIESLHKDAERYRWLRKSGLEIAWNAQVSFLPGYDEGDADAMDKAIDAAINGANA